MQMFSRWTHSHNNYGPTVRSRYDACDGAKENECGCIRHNDIIVRPAVHRIVRVHSALKRYEYEFKNLFFVFARFRFVCTIIIDAIISTAVCNKSKFSSSFWRESSKRRNTIGSRCRPNDTIIWCYIKRRNYKHFYNNHIIFVRTFISLSLLEPVTIRKRPSIYC